ncbi:hypothetical protein [Amycolatopsis sp. NPDC058986]|uniref:hypothetical protein n=1 Tax=unclassified Amycolatopsis TaxID=2618356 RepID=UPI00366AA65C
MSHSGVEVSAWVRIDNCGIEYRLCDGAVEFSLGGRMDGFQFDATERGLEQLVETGSQALRALRAAGQDSPGL